MRSGSNAHRRLDAERLDLELVELVAFVADLRTLRKKPLDGTTRQTMSELMARIDDHHDRILSLAGFGFLMHAVGCACADCARELEGVHRMPTLPPSPAFGGRK